MTATRGAYLMNLGLTDYHEAWELQRSLAAAVSQGAIPDTVILLEHPPTITLGRRTDPGELHVPEGVDVDVVETDRGGKSTFHGPGQLVCYPILDLKRHGSDVKLYCRDLEQAIIHTVAAFGLEATRIEGLTGVWLESPPRKIASIGVHISRWVTTHGYALNVDLDPAPFTEWITACGLEDAAFTSLARETGRPVSVDDVRPHRRPTRSRRSSGSRSTSYRATSPASGPSRCTRSSPPAGADPGVDREAHGAWLPAADEHPARADPHPCRAPTPRRCQRASFDRHRSHPSRRHAERRASARVNVQHDVRPRARRTAPPPGRRASSGPIVTVP